MCAVIPAWYSGERETLMARRKVPSPRGPGAGDVGAQTWLTGKPLPSRQYLIKTLCACGLSNPPCQL